MIPDPPSDVAPSPEALLARLTDSPPVVTVCAWCKDFNPRDPANRGVSHGICPDCRAKFEQEVA